VTGSEALRLAQTESNLQDVTAELVAKALCQTRGISIKNFRGAPDVKALPTAIFSISKKAPALPVPKATQAPSTSSSSSFSSTSLPSGWRLEEGGISGPPYYVHDAKQQRAGSRQLVDLYERIWAEANFAASLLHSQSDSSAPSSSASSSSSSSSSTPSLLSPSSSPSPFSSSPSSVNLNTSTTSDQVQLPVGWRLEISRASGKPYFYHQAKQRAVWTLQAVWDLENSWDVANSLSFQPPPSYSSTASSSSSSSSSAHSDYRSASFQSTSISLSNTSSSSSSANSSAPSRDTLCTFCVQYLQRQGSKNYVSGSTIVQAVRNQYGRSVDPSLIGEALSVASSRGLGVSVKNFANNGSFDVNKGLFAWVAKKK
jgi:hypothetical protein